MFKLSDIYQALLGAIIRFFDNRFQRQEDELVSLLRTELDKERYEKGKLIDAVLKGINTASVQEVQESINEKEPEPTGRVNWKATRARLEREAYERARKNHEQAEESLKKETLPIGKLETVEDIERELDTVGVDKQNA